MEEIFHRLEEGEAAGKKISLFVSFVENYLDTLRDLGIPYAALAEAEAFEDEGGGYPDQAAKVQPDPHLIPGHC